MVTRASRHVMRGVVFSFDNVADMKAATQMVVGSAVRTLGYYEPGDGGGNDYEIVAAGTGADDGGSFIDLSGSGLQAKGSFGAVVNVRQFGAKGDGATEDTTAFQSAIDFARSVFVPADGEYVVGALTLSNSDGSRLYGAGDDSRIRHKVGEDNLFDCSSSSETVEFQSLYIDGDRQNQAAESDNRLIYSLNNSNGPIFRVMNCRFINICRNAVYAFGDGTAPRADLLVSGCSFSNINEGDDAQYNPAYVAFGDGVDGRVHGNLLESGYDFSGFGAQAVTLQSRLAASPPQYSRCSINNNRIAGLGRKASNDLGAIEFYIWGENVIISNNDMKSLYSHAIRGKSNSNNVTITGNTVLTADGEGIVVNSGTGGTALGRCVISGNSTIGTKGSGIAYRSSEGFGRAENVIIVGNSIDDVTANAAGRSDAIWCESIVSLSVHSNVIRGSSKRGVYVNNCTISSVYSNHIISLDGEAIYVEDVADANVKGNIVNTFDNIGVLTLNAMRSYIEGNIARGNGNTGATNTDFRVVGATYALVTANFSGNSGSEISGSGNTTLVINNNSWQ